MFAPKKEGHCGHNATKLHVPRKAHSQFLFYVSVSHTQTIFQTPIYVSIFLLFCAYYSSLPIPWPPALWRRPPERRWLSTSYVGGGRRPKRSGRERGPWGRSQLRRRRICSNRWRRCRRRWGSLTPRLLGNGQSQTWPSASIPSCSNRLAQFPNFVVVKLNFWVWNCETTFAGWFRSCECVWWERLCGVERPWSCRRLRETIEAVDSVHAFLQETVSRVFGFCWILAGPCPSPQPQSWGRHPLL